MSKMCDMTEMMLEVTFRHNKLQLECAVGGVPSQIPTLKFLTPPPAPPRHTPGA